MKPHKHAELIKAWADGAEIQLLDDNGIWLDFREGDTPAWNPAYKYRVKPQPKPESSQPTKMAVLYNKYQHRYEIGMACTYWNREQFDLIGYFEVLK